MEHLEAPLTAEEILNRVFKELCGIGTPLRKVEAQYVLAEGYRQTCYFVFTGQVNSTHNGAAFILTLGEAVGFGEMAPFEKGMLYGRLDLPLPEDIPSHLVKHRILERGVFSAEGRLYIRRKLSAFERIPEVFYANSQRLTYTANVVPCITKMIREDLELNESP